MSGHCGPLCMQLCTLIVTRYTSSTENSCRASRAWIDGALAKLCNGISLHSSQLQVEVVLLPPLRRSRTKPLRHQTPLRTMRSILTFLALCAPTSSFMPTSRIPKTSRIGASTRRTVLKAAAEEPYATLIFLRHGQSKWNEVSLKCNSAGGAHTHLHQHQNHQHHLSPTTHPTRPPTHLPTSGQPFHWLGRRAADYSR